MLSVWKKARILIAPILLLFFIEFPRSSAWMLGPIQSFDIEKIPSLSDWKALDDGSVRGTVYGHPSFSNGKVITTSPLITERAKVHAAATSEVTKELVVTTSSGSKYRLSKPAPSRPQHSPVAKGFLGGTLKISKQEQFESRSVQQVAPSHFGLTHILESLFDINTKTKDEPRVEEGSYEMDEADVLLAEMIEQQQHQIEESQQMRSQKQAELESLPQVWDWRVVEDGSVQGYVHNHASFKDGTLMMTSQIVENEMDLFLVDGEDEEIFIVTTVTGSKYLLLGEPADY